MRGLADMMAPALPKGAAPVQQAQQPRRRGILQGFNPLRFENNGMTGSERLMGIGALLADIGGGQGNVAAVQQMRQQQAERDREAQQREAQQEFARSLMGGAMTKGQPGDGQGGARVLTPREAAPALLRAQAMGLDTGDALAILNAAAPDLQFVNGVGVDARDAGNVGQRIGFSGSNVNGTIVDLQDPANRDRFVPQVGEGQELLRDAQGNPVVRNISGYVQAQSDQRSGVETAVQAAQAPYRFLQVTGPNGEPMTVAVSNMVGGAVAGQSTEDRARDQARGTGAGQSATDLAARASRAPAAISNYLTALDDLPYAITGLGAEQRLNFARLLAGAGNEDAQREVAATESYRLITGRDFGQLIRDVLGSTTQFSNTDRQFLEQLSAGNIELNPETLRRALELQIQSQVDTLNRAGIDYAIRVASPEQAARLPRGTVFETPDGRRIVRQ